MMRKNFLFIPLSYLFLLFVVLCVPFHIQNQSFACVLWHLSIRDDGWFSTTITIIFIINTHLQSFKLPLNPKTSASLYHTHTKSLSKRKQQCTHHIDLDLSADFSDLSSAERYSVESTPITQSQIVQNHIHVQITKKSVIQDILPFY